MSTYRNFPQAAIPVKYTNADKIILFNGNYCALTGEVTKRINYCSPNIVRAIK
jgi:hypothetical protein